MEKSTIFTFLSLLMSPFLLQTATGAMGALLTNFLKGTSMSPTRNAKLSENGDTRRSGVTVWLLTAWSPFSRLDEFRVYVQKPNLSDLVLSKNGSSEFTNRSTCDCG